MKTLFHRAGTLFLIALFFLHPSNTNLVLASQAGGASPAGEESPAAHTALAAPRVPEKAVQISAGGKRTCMVTNLGGVKCWGAVFEWFDGTGMLVSEQYPAPWVVPGLSSGVAAIDVSESHACALTKTGGVKCFGRNDFGQLGNGKGGGLLKLPVDVVGLTSGVKAVTVGTYHSCALTTAGGVKCWGDNSAGQLGDGTQTGRATPVNVVGLTSGVNAISAGEAHTCALTTMGGVKCWGYYGTTPVSIAGLTSGVTAISSGSSYSCAVTSASEVKCWGKNDSGQLGNGTNIDSETPVNVVGLTNPVNAVAAGDRHACALTSTGGAICWGNNSAGQLGNASFLERESAADVTGLNSEVLSIAAGSAHTCAITRTGGVTCWGYNAQGQVGDGTGGEKLSSVDVVGLYGEAKDASAGTWQTCVLTNTGVVKCWGINKGTVGDGTTVTRPVPVDVVDYSSRVAAVSASITHTCALTETGEVLCWGLNTSGQLGDGTTTNRPSPVFVTGLPSGIIAVSAGVEHTCAVTATGGVKCWGKNDTGQLGDGTKTNRLFPVDAKGLTSGVKSVSAGYGHTCAITSSGALKCWGMNNSGQLGNGTVTSSPTPVNVKGLTSGVKVVSAGGGYTCAVTGAGGAKCWGINAYGQVGDDSRINKWQPVDVIGLTSGVLSIATEELHTCAVTTAGGVKCWGWNSSGELGDGTRNIRLKPVDTVGVTRAISVMVGTDRTCAVLSTGGMKCWGNNGSGELGDNTVFRPTPVDAFVVKDKFNYLPAVTK